MVLLDPRVSAGQKVNVTQTFERVVGKLMRLNRCLGSPVCSSPRLRYGVRENGLKCVRVRVKMALSRADAMHACPTGVHGRQLRGRLHRLPESPSHNAAGHVHGQSQ